MARLTDLTIQNLKPADGIAKENETVEREWFPLWSEMVFAAADGVKRKRHPERMRVAP
jgi:hypothetical protein